MNNVNNVCNQNLRIIAVSDLHGRASYLERIIENHPDAAAIFFMGDGLEDALHVMAFYPNIPFYAVHGNCDGFMLNAEIKEKTLGGKKIIYTHGHSFGVKHGLEHIKSYAKAAGADLCLFGHTHTAYHTYEDGVHFLNPGSPSKPVDSPACYAVVDIYNGQIFCNHIKI